MPIFQYRYLLFVAILLVPYCLFSQSNHTVKGKIIDKAAAAPIEFAEVVIRGDKSSFVTMTDELGDFSFTLNDKGDYIITVSLLGKLLHEKKYTISGNTVLETIAVDQPTELKEVVINKQQQLIERKGDRLIFNVENSINSTGGDAIDVLKVTPGIMVHNDQVSMIGKSGMGIMVNERFIQLSGDDLSNFLKSLKSDQIKKIEVIANPPSKYEAQGNSGIINIVTKKVKDNSLYGSIRSTLSVSKKSIFDNGFNLNYKKDRLTLTSSVSYTNGRTSPYQEYTLNYPEYVWKEQNSKTNYLNNLSGRFTAEYYLTKKIRIGSEYSISHNSPLVKSPNNSYIYNNNKQLDSIIETRSRLTADRNTNTVNVFSIIELDTLGRRINVDLDYVSYKSATDNNFSTNTYLPDGSAVSNRFFGAQNVSNQDIDIFSTRFDVEAPTKFMSMNFGFKLSFINNKSGVNFFSTNSGEPVFVEGNSNQFRYDENIQAIYFSANKKISQNFDVQFGLRGENTQTKGVSITLNQTNKNNYFKLFPTLYLNYSLGPQKILSFNYNRRINRPSYADLNPFRFYSTSFNYSEGNPFLRPYFTDNFELSYVYHNLYSSLFSSFLNNSFNQVTFVSPDSVLQVVRPENFFNQFSAGFLQAYTFRVKDFFESSNQYTAFYTKTNSKIDAVVPDIKNFTANFSTNNTWIMDKARRFRTEIGFMYQFPSIAGSYKVSDFYELNLGLKSFFFNQKLQFTISCSDVLKTNKQTYTQVVNGIRQSNYDYRDLQRIRFSLIYNFGKTFQIKSKEDQSKEEKDRLK